MSRNNIPRQKSLSTPEVLNPFVHKLNLSLRDKIQIAIMSVTIAPIRLVLVLLLLLLAWPFAALAVAFRSEEDKLKPITGWRLLLRPIVLVLCRGVFFAGGLYWVKTKGKQASSKEAPLLLLAPHSSFLDALPTVFLGLTSVVAKASTQDMILFGTLTKFSQPVLVKREDPNSRINTIKEIQRRAQSGGRWPQIIIFPEGTCTNRTCLIAFKQGAFYPGVPVQPVCVKYPNRLDTVTWTWEGPGAFSQLWFTLCQFYTRIEIEYLPVYTPSEAEKKDPKLFANNVREKMASCLGVPVTDHTYDDCRLMNDAEKMKLPMNAGIVEFEKLHSKLGVSYEEVQGCLKRFRDIKGSKEKEKVAQITYDEFSQYLYLPKSDALLEVFKLFDRDGSGTIDFREYVIGLSLVAAPANNDDTILLAFQLFDDDNKGYITESDLTHILKGAFLISDEDIDNIFKELNTSHSGKITLDEFKNYAKKKPEYARVFMTYQELKEQNCFTGKEKELFSKGQTDFKQWHGQVDESDKKLQ
ncbi:lysophosphatidylcholine acyltransferase 2-like isoform X2 [Biomphalaria glabrata]|uniref:Lysophosphatidylcholine acyltransferase 2-like isoform X2 n=1 Tax=Biomphalaria glabrata TaxID=6526 RepID=A0A9W3AUL8_BIOGL|nr:lysophosphatidylcholine acyltransferase 2-like isoform X2 [Biomphalaria glabrata]